MNHRNRQKPDALVTRREFLAWADAEGWEIVGDPREVYLVHPDASGGGDPEQFVTELQFPVNA